MMMQHSMFTTPMYRLLQVTRRIPVLLSMLLVMVPGLLVTLAVRQPLASAADAPLSILKDINPGSADALPFGTIDVNGTLFFAADDGSHGHELWKSDGTPAGTVMLKDINPGPAPSSPSHLLARDDGVFFFLADDGTNGQELWRSDGTADGTTLVKAVVPDNLPFGPQMIMSLTDVNGTIFYSFIVQEQGEMFPTYPHALWKSDGTAAGTVQVTTFPDFVGPPESFINVNGTLFFTYLEQLWKSDGTAAGTVMVKHINSGSDASNAPFLKHLTNMNGTLFFSARETSTGQELWKSDGTEAGTVMVKDIRTGLDENNRPAGSFPHAFTVMNDILFFAAWSNIPNYTVLWKSDGTAAGTVMVKDVGVDTAKAQRPILAIDGLLYFRGGSTEYGSELWKSDGSEAGTVLVKNIRHTNMDSQADHFTNLNGTLYFNATSSAMSYATKELWKSDGTAAGTIQLVDELEFVESMAFQNKLLLTRKTSEQGMELWLFDPALAGNTSTNSNFPDGAPGSTFVVTVADLPAGASAAISVRGPNNTSFTPLGTSTVPEDGTLIFMLLTDTADLTGTFTIRIVVESITRETTITLDSTAPLRSDRPADEVPELDLSSSDETGGGDPANTKLVYLPMIYGPGGN